MTTHSAPDGADAPEIGSDALEIGSDAPLGACAIALLGRWRTSRRGLLFVSNSERRAERLGAILHALEPATGVMVFPRWDRLPFDPGPPSREVMGRRASVLRRLAEGSGAPLVLTTAEATLQHLPPRETWGDAVIRLRRGDECDPGKLEAFLARAGYELETEVSEPGQAAIRGQVVDIYPAGALGPVRVEQEDGRVSALSSYDAATQRTTGDLDEVVLDAASEIIARDGDEAADDLSVFFERAVLAGHPRLETIFDYMPDALRVLDAGLDARIAAWREQVAQGHQAQQRLRAASGEEGAVAPVEPDRFYLPADMWRARLNEGAVHQMPEGWGRCDKTPNFATARAPGRSYRRFLGAEQAAGRRVVLAAADKHDLHALLSRARTAKTAPRAETWPDVEGAEAGSLMSLRADFDAGFGLPDLGVTVVAAADLLGSRASHNAPIELRRATLGQTSGFQAGDAVIHLQHGVGLLRGLDRVSAPGLAEREMVRLEYAGETSLLAPVEEMGAVWRYGGDPEAVTLDRADGESWWKRRDAVQADIDATARSLIQLAKEREGEHAPKLVPPAAEYERFVARFAYSPTPDQSAAVEDILSDLASGHPMDRLVCGDVGFGKTEVALRAAAAAALAGKQVAVVAPTTVLARQHLHTFARRFAGLGVAVAQLSRLVKPAEARRVKAGLKSGEIRLVIGTHALASKTVQFKDLGLLIIDEEQRFGARDKAKLRALGRSRHVLTMTATPIPRTLLAAQAGLQSLSVLATPPARRVPVRTLPMPFDPARIRDALLYERQRGGQSFVVVPRIEDIAEMADLLAKAAPRLDLKIVHGKLPPEEVDETMVGFAEGRGDVLLATNIIESGLDVPRANTILISRPDRFGLAQLHQLRGRVGRGSRRGLAYVLLDGETSEGAQKRLDVFQSLDGIGAGFAISERDMDLRGAGDLLGEEQAGHVKLLGVDLHRHLLERALAQARGETPPPDWRPELHFDGLALIPEDYVPEPELRLNLYARLAKSRTLDEIDAFSEEMEDRFGPLPLPAQELLRRASIAQLCRELGVVRVDAGPQGVAFSFVNDAAKPKTEIPDTRWKGDRLIRAVSGGDEGRSALVFDMLDALAAS